MRIKSIVPVGTDYAVLATCKADFSGTCYDQQGDGTAFSGLWLTAIQEITSN